MSENSGSQEKPINSAVIIAAIGAIATIITACLTGFFGLLPVLIERAEKSAPPTLTAPPTAQAAAEAATTATMTGPAPTTAPAPTKTPAPPAGLLFASKIAANGRALDPSAEFRAGITDLYAVFPAGMTPPGTMVSAQNTREGEYFAFLKVAQDSQLSRIGWRWLRGGDVVNEYEIEVSPGDDVWLSYTNPQEGGIFGAAGFPPGRYTIVITLGGNPSVSGDLVILPQP